MPFFGHHCTVAVTRTIDKWLLLADQDTIEQYQYVELAQAKCRKCAKDLYYWRGVQYGEGPTPWFRIKDNHVQDWLDKLPTHQIAGGISFKIHVGDYTLLMAKDPANLSPKKLRLLTT